MSESSKVPSLYAILGQGAPSETTEAASASSLRPDPEQRPKPQPTTLTFTLESADYDSSAASTFVGISR